MIVSNSRPRVAAALLVWVIAASVGCDPPPRPLLSTDAEAPLVDEIRAASKPAGAANSAGSGEFVWRKPNYTQAWETWQSLYVGGKHIGYSHVNVEAADDRSDGNMRVTLIDQVLLRRGTANILQRYEQRTIEGRDGQVISMEAELRVGPTVTKYSGNISNDSLALQTIRGTGLTRSTIPWPYDAAGSIAVQQSLLNEPIEVGEERSLTTLLPIRFQVSKAKLKCGSRAAIAMPDGSVSDALEIDVSITPEGTSTPLDSVIWTDDKGRVVKTYNPAVDLVSFTTSREQATTGIEVSDDVLTATSVRVEGAIGNPDQVALTVFQLTPRGQQPDSKGAEAVQPLPGQWVRKIEGGGYQVLVSSVAPTSDYTGFEGSELAVTDADRQPGPLITSDQPNVTQQAEASLLTKGTQAQMALDLATGVNALLKEKTYADGWATASEILARGSGDCTSHAVLLAAMLRAKGIPSRVAVGLVYIPVDTGPRMVYHMWNLAYVDGQWIHVDATRTGGVARADRITLGTHDLASGNEFDVIASVIGFMGRYDVKVVRSSLDGAE